MCRFRQECGGLSPAYSGIELAGSRPLSWDAMWARLRGHRRRHRGRLRGHECAGQPCRSLPPAALQASVRAFIPATPSALLAPTPTPPLTAAPIESLPTGADDHQTRPYPRPTQRQLERLHALPGPSRLGRPLGDSISADILAKWRQGPAVEAVRPLSTGFGKGQHPIRGLSRRSCYPPRWPRSLDLDR